MDKVAGPGPGSPRRWAPRGGAKAGRELASAVGSGSGETSDPGPKVIDTLWDFCMPRRKGKRERFWNKERGVVTPESHSIFLICL